MSRWQGIVLAATGGLVLLAAVWFGSAEPPPLWWQQTPAAYAIVGLGGSWVLARALKSLLQRWLQRPADYYDD